MKNGISISNINSIQVFNCSAENLVFEEAPIFYFDHIKQAHISNCKFRNITRKKGIGSVFYISNFENV